MTDEISYFWDGFTPGDAALAYHPSKTYKELYELLLMTNSLTEGVVRFYENTLTVSNPAGNTIRLASGAALVAGRFYTNDANIDTSISTPSIATRYDRVILRCDFAGQTIRAAIRTGTEGGGVPALVQNSQYWDIPLATISITTAPVITITDERDYAVSKLTDIVTTSALGWTLLDSFEGTGSQNIIEFSGDFSNYQHLVVMGSLRHAKTDVDGKLSNLAMVLNDNTGNIYISNYQGVIDTTVAVPAMTSGIDSMKMTYFQLMQMVSDAGLASAFGSLFMWFFNPNETDQWKQFEIYSGAIGSSHADPAGYYFLSGMAELVNAITKIAFYNPSDPTGFFSAGSSLQLYGIEG